MLLLTFLVAVPVATFTVPAAPVGAQDGEGAGNAGSTRSLPTTIDECEGCSAVSDQRSSGYHPTGQNKTRLSLGKEILIVTGVIGTQSLYLRYREQGDLNGVDARDAYRFSKLQVPQPVQRVVAAAAIDIGGDGVEEAAILYVDTSDLLWIVVRPSERSEPFDLDPWRPFPAHAVEGDAALGVGDLTGDGREDLVVAQTAKGQDGKPVVLVQAWALHSTTPSEVPHGAALFSPRRSLVSPADPYPGAAFPGLLVGMATPSGGRGGRAAIVLSTNTHDDFFDPGSETFDVDDPRVLVMEFDADGFDERQAPDYRVPTFQLVTKRSYGPADFGQTRDVSLGYWRGSEDGWEAKSKRLRNVKGVVLVAPVAADIDGDLLDETVLLVHWAVTQAVLAKPEGERSYYFEGLEQGRMHALEDGLGVGSWGPYVVRAQSSRSSCDGSLMAPAQLDSDRAYEIVCIRDFGDREGIMFHDDVSSSFGLMIPADESPGSRNRDSVSKSSAVAIQAADLNGKERGNLDDLFIVTRTKYYDSSDPDQFSISKNRLWLPETEKNYRGHDYLRYAWSTDHGKSAGTVIVALDADGDGIVARYLGPNQGHERLLTNPTVKARVAAPPVVAGSGQGPGTVTISMSDQTCNTYGEHTTAGTRLGAGVSGKDVLGVTEAEIMVTLSASMEGGTSDTFCVSKSRSWSSSAGEDLILFEQTPIDLYWYELLAHPDRTKIGERVLVAQPGRAYIDLWPISEYNAAIRSYNDAIKKITPPIGMDLQVAAPAATFSHTVGVPTTYKTASEKDTILIKAGFKDPETGNLINPRTTGNVREAASQSIADFAAEVGPEGVPSGRTAMTLAVDALDAESNHYKWTMELNVDAKIKIGVGQIAAGITVGRGESYAIDTKTGQGFSASIPGIPDRTIHALYGYHWGMFVYPTKVGEDDVFVIDHWVLPQGQRAGPVPRADGSPRTIDPKPGQTGPTPMFRWGAVSNAISYEVELEETTPYALTPLSIREEFDHERGRSVYEWSITETFAQRLPPGHTYRWRVRGVDQVDAGPWSPWSHFATAMVPVSAGPVAIANVADWTTPQALPASIMDSVVADQWAFHYSAADHLGPGRNTAMLQRVNDTSPAGNDGTFESNQTALRVTRGPRDEQPPAFEFKKAGEVVLVNRTGPAPQMFTILAWVRAEPGDSGKIIGFERREGDVFTHWDRHLYLADDGRLHFGMFDVGEGKAILRSSDRPITDGRWHLVFATNDPRLALPQLFVDGSPAGDGEPFGRAASYDGRWVVGGGHLGAWPHAPTDPQFTGQIAHIAVLEGYAIPDYVAVYGKDAHRAEVQGLSPHDRSTTDVRFQWEPLDGLGPDRIGGATTYKVQVSHDADHTQPAFEITTRATESHLSLPEGDWFVRVRGQNQAGAGNWGPTLWFGLAEGVTHPETRRLDLDPPTEAPAPTFARHPLADRAIAPLSWAHVNNTDRYQVRYSPASGDAYIVETGDEHWTPVPASPRGPAQVSVRAGNDDGWGPWSEAVDFDLPAPPEGRPTLAGTVGPEGPEAPLSWESVDGAWWYEFQVALTGGFNDTVALYEFTGERFDPKDLVQGQYYGRVRAANAGGTGPWSDGLLFSTKSAPLGTPTLRAAQIDGTPVPPLSWTPVRDAGDYEVSITSADGTHIRSFRVADLTLGSPELMPGSYRATVRGMVGDWPGPESDPVRFVVPTAPAGAPVLDAPLVDHTVEVGPVEKTVRFHMMPITWEPIDGTDHYEIEVGLSSDFQNPVRSLEQTETSYSDSTLAGGEYWVRVRGVHLSAGGPWSEPMPIFVEPQSGTPGAPLLVVLFAVAAAAAGVRRIHIGPGAPPRRR